MSSVSAISGEGEVSIDFLLDTLPVGPFHYRLLSVCGLSFIADGIEVSLLSFVATCAGREWGLSGSQQALIASIVFLGQLVG